MAPLGLILVLAALPAAAQGPKSTLKNERGCTSAMQKRIDDSFPEAKRRIAAAKAKVAAKDAGAAGYGRLLIGSGYNETEVGGILDLMAGALASPVVKCSTEKDEHCGARAGYVSRAETNTIHLCPLAFVDKSADGQEQMTRTVVHESAHLAHPDISEPGGESYCVFFTCGMSCGSGPKDSATGKNVPARVADNWSQFVHCASGQPHDEGEVITVKRPK